MAIAYRRQAWRLFFVFASHLSHYVWASSGSIRRCWPLEALKRRSLIYIKIGLGFRGSFMNRVDMYSWCARCTLRYITNDKWRRELMVRAMKLCEYRQLCFVRVAHLVYVLLRRQGEMDMKQVMIILIWKTVNLSLLILLSMPFLLKEIVPIAAIWRYSLLTHCIFHYSVMIMNQHNHAAIAYLLARFDSCLWSNSFFLSG